MKSNLRDIPESMLVKCNYALCELPEKDCKCLKHFCKCKITLLSCKWPTCTCEKCLELNPMCECREENDK